MIAFTAALSTSICLSSCMLPLVQITLCKHSSTTLSQSQRSLMSEMSASQISSAQLHLAGIRTNCSNLASQNYWYRRWPQLWCYTYATHQKLCACHCYSGSLLLHHWCLLAYLADYHDAATWYGNLHACMHAATFNCWLLSHSFLYLYSDYYIQLTAGQHTIY